MHLDKLPSHLMGLSSALRGRALEPAAGTPPLGRTKVIMTGKVGRIRKEIKARTKEKTRNHPSAHDYHLELPSLGGLMASLSDDISNQSKGT